MYNCDVCKSPAAARQSRLVWPVKRADGSILREVPVCHRCLKALAGGIELPKLRALHKLDLSEPEYKEGTPSEPVSEEKGEYIRFVGPPARGMAGAAVVEQEAPSKPKRSPRKKKVQYPVNKPLSFKKGN